MTKGRMCTGTSGGAWTGRGHSWLTCLTKGDVAGMRSFSRRLSQTVGHRMCTRLCRCVGLWAGVQLHRQCPQSGANTAAAARGQTGLGRNRDATLRYDTAGHRQQCQPLDALLPPPPASRSRHCAQTGIVLAWSHRKGKDAASSPRQGHNQGLGNGI